MIILLLLLLSLLTHWQWTFSLAPLTSGDWIYQDPDMLKEFFATPSIWSPTAFGSVNLGISFTPFNFIYGLFSNWGFSYGLSERIVFLWPILIALPLGMYFLIKKNISSVLAAVIGSLVYSYNTYFSIMKTGHLTLLIAYAFIPLVILFFQKTLEKKSISYALLAGLFGFIVSFYEFRAFYIVCFILFFYFLFHIFFIERIKGFKRLALYSLYAALPILIVVLLNMYWLLALANTGTLVSNTAFNRGLFGNEFLNILHAFTFHHPFWTGTKSAIFEVQPIPFYFWLIPVFAFFGLFFNRKNPAIIFFGCIALLGIFLTKQTGQPFSDTYQWLFENFPGFNAFREASKFYLLIALGYSMLIAGFVDWLWNRWKVKGRAVYARYVITVLIALLFVWNLKPIVTGEFRTLFVAREMPSDYVIVKNFIMKQDEYFRTLWVPTYSRWSIFSNNHPEVSAVNLINAEWRALVKRQEDDKRTEGEIIIDAMQLPQADLLLDTASVKYVFVPLEDTKNEDNFIVDYKEPRLYYINELDKIPYLKKLSIGTNQIAVYENTAYKPHVYTTQTKESLQKVIPFKKVDFTMISPSEYNVHIPDVSKPFYLTFSENYHPDWRVRINDFAWHASLLDSQYFMPQEGHFHTESKMNSYYIDPKEVCANTGACIKKNENTYDIKMTIYFRPQSYLYIGGIISMITIAGIVLYFAVRKVRKYEK